MVVATGIFLMVNLCFSDYAAVNVFIDHQVFNSCFYNSYGVMQGWITMWLYSLLIVPIVKLITTYSITFKAWVTVVVIYYFGFLRLG